MNTGEQKHGFESFEVRVNCSALLFCPPPPQMSFHVIYKAPCGLCLRNMSEIQHYLFQTNCDFIFLEMFCLDPYVLVDRPFQPQRPFYYIPDITSGREDIPLSCVNEIDSTPPPKVAYSKNSSFKVSGVNDCGIKWSKWSFSRSWIAKATGLIRLRQ